MPNKDDMTPRRQRCSFCGKSADQVYKLIAGPSVYICDECIALCHSLISETMEAETEVENKKPDFKEIPSPVEMKKVLDNLKVEKAVLVVDGSNENVVLSARNLPGVVTMSPDSLNTYELLKYNTVVTTKAGVAAIEEVYA